jgi:error-prone DNA polymerase
MATFKMTGGVSHFYDKLVGGMVARGYSLDFAERTFKQIEGFGSYGFPESHAASFAKIAYASCWMKHHHPDVFCASLLNAQPMGFYAPAQIVADARKHGVEVRPVSINPAIGIARSNTPPPASGCAAGLPSGSGLANLHGARIVAARGDQPYGSVEEVWRRAGVRARRSSDWPKPMPFRRSRRTGGRGSGRSRVWAKLPCPSCGRRCQGGAVLARRCRADRDARAADRRP